MHCIYLNLGKYIYKFLMIFFNTATLKHPKFIMQYVVFGHPFNTLNAQQMGLERCLIPQVWQMF